MLFRSFVLGAVLGACGVINSNLVVFVTWARIVRQMLTNLLVI